MTAPSPRCPVCGETRDRFGECLCARCEGDPRAGPMLPLSQVGRERRMQGAIADLARIVAGVTECLAPGDEGATALAEIKRQARELERRMRP